MWRHVVAASIAIAITLVMLEFWGNFSGVMTHFVEVKAAHDQAKVPVPVSVISAPAPAPCAKDRPCPKLPNEQP